MSTTTTRVELDLGAAGTTGSTGPAIATGRTTGTTGAEPALAPVPARTGAHHRLLATLRAALRASAQLDPDALGSLTPARGAAAPLAGTVRSATAALGGDPGMGLTHAPGLAVGRELGWRSR